MGKKAAAGYVRVSTDRQSDSVTDQKRILQEFAAKTGREIKSWFIDENRSGTTAEGRPEFQRMIDTITKGKAPFEEILVYSPDRFGRFIDPEEATYYRVLCKKGGVRIVYVADEFLNQENIGSRIMLAAKQDLAMEESKSRSNLVLERSRLNTGRGFSNGGRPAFGYQRWVVEPNGNRRLLLPGKHKSEKTEKVIFLPGPDKDIVLVQRIFEMRGIKQLGYGAIADILNRENIPSPTGNKWGKPYLTHMLRNPIYIGILTYGKTKRGKFRSLHVENVPESEWAKATIPDMAIIDSDLWEKVRATDKVCHANFREKDKGRSSTSTAYLLSGLIECLECGNKFQGRRRRNHEGREYFYYTDGRSVNPGRSVCSPYHIQRDYLESEVIGFVQRAILRGINPERLLSRIEKSLAKAAGSGKSRLKEIEQAKKRVNRQLRNVVAAVADGADFSLFHDQIQNLQTEEKRLDQEAVEIKTVTCKKTTLRSEAIKIVNQIHDLGRVLASGTPRQRKAIIRRFVAKIEVSQKKNTATVYVRPLPVLESGQQNSWSVRYMPEVGIEPTRD